MTADATAPAPPPAAPRKRAFETRRSVIIIDRIADYTIRVGGIGVIAAVFAIMLFLFAVVVPLFTGGKIDGEVSHPLPLHGRALFDRVDDYRTLALSVEDDGQVSAVHAATGTPIAAPAFDFGGAKASAFSATLTGNDVAFGLPDGTVWLGTLVIQGSPTLRSELPAGLKTLANGELTDGRAIFTKLGDDQYRKVAVAAALEAPIKVADGVAITALDYRVGSSTERPTKTFVSRDAAGTLRLSMATSRKNMMTGKVSTQTESIVLPGLPADVELARLIVTEKGDQVYAADRSGRIYRYDTRDPKKPVLAESFNILRAGVGITAIGFLIGEQSLVVTGNDGSVGIYFRLPVDRATSTDGRTLVLAHKLDKQPGAITAFAASQRSRLFATADSTGQVWVRHGTSEQTLLKLQAPSDAGRIVALAMAPREDGVLAVTDSGRYVLWAIEVPHPETTIASILGKIWYEGYEGPGFTWQSSSGTDSFEPKLSLIPLIFGTIKAAFYSLLFAVPIAIGAAIYTSEFLHPNVRAAVKPGMEMMASLPSVVLGFIAALILAPIVETWITAVILAFLFLPLALFIGAYLWQMLPLDTQLRFGGVPKFALMFAAIIIAVWAAQAASPGFERLLFAGDFMAWASGQRGSDLPFMTLLLLPVSGILAKIAIDRTAGPRISLALQRAEGTKAGLIDGARWLATVALALVLSFLISWLLTVIGLGARNGLVGTYVQRNTLVVGFAMAFAVIPIIYTIAEDALNSVPEHLRAASLACGASTWQTALSVILPTAVSGVFAAVMVGMGRAVGETMIVVMAAGNTPLIDWNLFNGLRALSANIAVELPEAVRNSTLYRMLFLAALALFVLTFVINTAAEVVRQRFRKRTAQL